MRPGCNQRAALAGPTRPAWSLWLLRFQVADSLFLRRPGQAQRRLAPRPADAVLDVADDRACSGLLPAFGELWLALVFSYGGLMFDLAIVPLLLWRRTRAVRLCVRSSRFM